MARTRLGRSLGDLLSQHTPTEPSDITAQSHLQELSVTLMDRGQFQPRRAIDPQALEELAQSIKAQGILQPIIVRPMDAGRYEIIAGERRWRAAQLAGLTTVPVIIKAVDDQTTMALALIENIQREDLSPIDEALAIERLIEDCQLTHQDVSNLLGASRTQITNLLRLLNLEPEVRGFLEEGKLDLSHAKVLLALNGREQIYAAEKVIACSLTVRETEALLANTLTPTSLIAENAKPLIDEHLQILQKHFSEILATKAVLKPGTRQGGKLVLHYKNKAELQAWLGRLQQALEQA